RRTTAEELRSDANAFADQAFAAMEAQAPYVELPPNTVNMLLRPNMRSQISGSIDPETGSVDADLFYDIIQQAQATGNPVFVPLRLLEDVRASINTRVSPTSGAAVNSRDAAEAQRHLAERLSEDVPGYAEYSELYGAMRRRVGEP